MKTCGNCKKDKPLSEFHKKGVYKSGEIKYSSRCKDCHNIGRVWHHSQKDKFKLAGFICY